MEAREIYIGMPVTLGCGSDCSPYEVVAINGSKVSIRSVKPINMESWSAGCNTTEYESDPMGIVRELNNRGKHGWHVTGDHYSRGWGWSYKVGFGVARYYRDPSF